MLSYPYPIQFECANEYANECANECAKTSHSCAKDHLCDASHTRSPVKNSTVLTLYTTNPMKCFLTCFWAKVFVCSVWKLHVMFGPSQKSADLSNFRHSSLHMYSAFHMQEPEV